MFRKALLAALGCIAAGSMNLACTRTSGNANDQTPSNGNTVDNANTHPNENSAANENENENENVNENGSSPQPTGDRLDPSDLTYEGAFRLPDDFNWGALGMTYYPDGDSGVGSLLVTGFELVADADHLGEQCWNPDWDCRARFAEVTIPDAAVESNWEDLPQASMVSGLTEFDNGLASTVSREYVYVSGLEYVPRRGSQSGDKLYGSINLWYAEGVMGEETFSTVWMSNVDGSEARGMFHVGPDEPPYHGRKMGSYLFSVPQWYADQYLGGRTLLTGRSRGTPANSSEEVTIEGGSQGPTLFAFHPWDSDNPSGNLDALPVLYYRVAFPGCGGPNVGDPSECDYPDYSMCDDWTGGAFVANDSRQAIMLSGYKGLGENCYDEPPVECDDSCSDSHGYHCHPYERQIVFYDVEQLGEVAQNEREPWTVVPYAIWRPTQFYLIDHPCSNLGGVAFDQQGRRLFVVERGLGSQDTNAVVVHVWSL